MKCNTVGYGFIFNYLKHSNFLIVKNVLSFFKTLTILIVKGKIKRKIYPRALGIVNNNVKEKMVPRYSGKHTSRLRQK